MAEAEEPEPPDTAAGWLSQEGYRTAWLNLMIEELKLECYEGLL